MAQSEEVEDFLLHMEKERDVSPHTLKAYRRDLTGLLEFFASYYGERDWSWQGVDRLALRGFLAHLNRRKLGTFQNGFAVPVCRNRSSS